MKKIVAILLAVSMLFCFASCKKEDGLTTKKVLKVAEKIENGKEIDKSDFDGYECEENENVYKTYTYEIDDRTSVIITTDKNTGETLESYLFCGTKYINLKEGKEAVEKFLQENSAPESTSATKAE